MTPEPSSGSYRLEVAAVPSGGPQVVGAPPQSVGDVDGGRGQTAFVLGGGGSLGAAQVGMLRALLEVGVRPDFVVGTSIGSLNAAYLAGHLDPDGIESMAELWSTVRRADVFPLSVRSLVRGVMGHRNHLVDALGLRTLIRRARNSALGTSRTLPFPSIPSPPIS